MDLASIVLDLCDVVQQLVAPTESKLLTQLATIKDAVVLHQHNSSNNNDGGAVSSILDPFLDPLDDPLDPLDPLDDPLEPLPLETKLRVSLEKDLQVETLLVTHKLELGNSAAFCFGTGVGALELKKDDWQWLLDLKSGAVTLTDALDTQAKAWVNAHKVNPGNPTIFIDGVEGSTVTSQGNMFIGPTNAPGTNALHINGQPFTSPAALFAMNMTLGVLPFSVTNFEVSGVLTYQGNSVFPEALLYLMDLYQNREQELDALTICGPLLVKSGDGVVPQVAASITNGEVCIGQSFVKEGQLVLDDELKANGSGSILGNTITHQSGPTVQADEFTLGGDLETILTQYVVPVTLDEYTVDNKTWYLNRREFKINTTLETVTVNDVEYSAAGPNFLPYELTFPTLSTPGSVFLDFNGSGNFMIDGKEITAQIGSDFSVDGAPVTQLLLVGQHRFVQYLTTRWDVFDQSFEEFFPYNLIVNGVVTPVPLTSIHGTPLSVLDGETLVLNGHVTGRFGPPILTINGDEMTHRIGDNTFKINGGRQRTLIVGAPAAGDDFSVQSGSLGNDTWTLNERKFTTDRVLETVTAPDGTIYSAAGPNVLPYVISYPGANPDISITFVAGDLVIDSTGAEGAVRTITNQSGHDFYVNAVGPVQVVVVGPHSFRSDFGDLWTATDSIIQMSLPSSVIIDGGAPTAVPTTSINGTSLNIVASNMVIDGVTITDVDGDVFLAGSGLPPVSVYTGAGGLEFSTTDGDTWMTATNLFEIDPRGQFIINSILFETPDYAFAPSMIEMNVSDIGVLTFDTGSLFTGPTAVSDVGGQLDEFKAGAGYIDELIFGPNSFTVVTSGATPEWTLASTVASDTFVINFNGLTYELIVNAGAPVLTAIVNSSVLTVDSVLGDLTISGTTVPFAFITATDFSVDNGVTQVKRFSDAYNRFTVAAGTWSIFPASTFFITTAFRFLVDGVLQLTPAQTLGADTLTVDANDNLVINGADVFVPVDRQDFRVNNGPLLNAYISAAPLTYARLDGIWGTDLHFFYIAQDDEVVGGYCIDEDVFEFIVSLKEDQLLTLKELVVLGKADIQTADVTIDGVPLSTDLLPWANGSGLSIPNQITLDRATINDVLWVLPNFVVTRVPIAPTHTGSGAPLISLGVSLDTYENTDNGDLYRKTGSVWFLIGNSGSAGIPTLNFNGDIKLGQGFDLFVQNTSIADLVNQVLVSQILDFIQAGEITLRSLNVTEDFKLGSSVAGSFQFANTVVPLSTFQRMNAFADGSASIVVEDLAVKNRLLIGGVDDDPLTEMIEFIYGQLIFKGVHIRDEYMTWLAFAADRIKVHAAIATSMHWEINGQCLQSNDESFPVWRLHHFNNTKVETGSEARMVQIVAKKPVVGDDKVGGVFMFAKLVPGDYDITITASGIPHTTEPYDMPAAGKYEANLYVMNYGPGADVKSAGALQWFNPLVDALPVGVTIAAQELNVDLATFGAFSTNAELTVSGTPVTVLDQQDFNVTGITLDTLGPDVRIVFTKPAVSEGNTYLLQRKYSTDSTFVMVDVKTIVSGLTTVTMVDTTVDPATNYTYRVLSIGAYADAVATVSWHSPVEGAFPNETQLAISLIDAGQIVSPGLAPVEMVQFFKSTRNSPTEVLLEWQRPVSGTIDSYDIYRRLETDAVGTYTLLDGPSPTVSIPPGFPITVEVYGAQTTETYVDTGVADGLNYVYKIVPKVGVNEAPHSFVFTDETVDTSAGSIELKVNGLAIDVHWTYPLNVNVNAALDRVLIMRRNVNQVGLNAVLLTPYGSPETVGPYTDTTAEVGVEYTYTVVFGIAGDSFSAIGSEASFQLVPPDNTALSSVNNLSATYDLAPRITWTQSISISNHYNVYRRPNLAGAPVFGLIKQTAFNGYIDNDALPNVQYRYRVHPVWKDPDAIVADEIGDEGMTVVATSGDDLSPHFIGLQGLLHWNSAPGISDRHRIGFDRLEISVELHHEAEDAGIDHLTQPEALEYVSPTVYVAPCVPVSNFVGTHTLPNTVLSWDFETHVTEYKLERSLAAPAVTSYSVIDANIPNHGPTYTDTTGLVAGEAYLYRMQTTNEGGFVGLLYAVSDVVYAGPPIIFVTALSLDTKTQTTIDIKWTAPLASGHSTYVDIERQEGAGFFTTIATNETGTTFSDLGLLTPATTYTYRVRAGNPGGTQPIAGAPTVTITTNP